MSDVKNFKLPAFAPEPPPEHKRQPKPPLDLNFDVGLPANVDAEKTILGAIILDNEAFYEASERLQSEDFSLDSNRRIFLRMKSLIDNKNTVDIVMLANELTRNKEIEAIGGVAYLASLTEGLPLRPVIEEYIRIVKDKAMLRGLMAVSAATIARAADQVDPALEIAGELATKLEDVISGGLQRGLQPVANLTIEVLDKYLTQADLIESPGFSFGVPGIDEATGGIQDGEQVVVGCYSGVGKTTFLAQITAANCSKGIPVAMFLIEPTRHTFLRQLWTIVAGVQYRAATKPWTATREEKDRIRWAAGQVAEWKLHIFDNSNLSLDEQLAHTRLAIHRHGVQLYGIDYLQRMRVKAIDKSDDTRLKIGRASTTNADLVKNTACRSVLLSQLNRSGGMSTIPTMDKLRECVAGETRVINAETGGLIKVNELVAGTVVLGMDNNQCIRAAQVRKVWSTGIRPVFKVKTGTGKEITCTANHPFFTATGWTTTDELRIGQCIATALEAPVNASRTDAMDLCRLLGYMTGDGTYLRSRSVGFISNDAITFKDVRTVVTSHWPNIYVRMKKHKQGYLEADFSIKNGFGNRNGNPLRAFLREVGVFNERDYQKHVPAYVWEHGMYGASEFLAGYLATDGCVKLDRSTQSWRIHFDTTSIQLAHDVQMLLQRLGVVSTIGKGYRSKKATMPLFRVAVSVCKDNLLRCATVIPVQGKKSELIKKAAEWCSVRTAITNLGPFGLPPEISCYAAIRHPGSWKDQNKMMSRGRALEIADRYKDPWLREFAGSELLWEKIVSIESAGESEVFDLSVPELGSFLANGIVVHNSGQIENDAMTIVLLHLKYDEEQGHFTSEGAGIIPKQRFGVPCNVALYKDEKTALWCSGKKPEPGSEQQRLYGN